MNSNDLNTQKQLLLWMCVKNITPPAPYRTNDIMVLIEDLTIQFANESSDVIINCVC